MKKQRQKRIGQPSTATIPNGTFTWDEAVLLEKEAGRDFVILNLSDVHFADYDMRALMAFSVMRTARRLVKTFQPNLITLSGDLVCSRATEHSVKRLTAFFDSLGVPWAPVFGNHDDEGNCDLNALADEMQKSPLCLLQKGSPALGVGNYLLRIAERQGESLHTVEAIFMLDSHRNSVNEAQLAWIARTAEGIRKQTDGEAELAALMHIPTADYEKAYAQAVQSGTLQGELHEKICCDRSEQTEETALLRTLQTAGAKHILCGHDHMNNFSVPYKGLRLTYMMKIGKASGYQPGFDGGTVLRVDGQGIRTIEHWTKSKGRWKNLLKVG